MNAVTFKTTLQFRSQVLPQVFRYRTRQVPAAPQGLVQFQSRLNSNRATIAKMGRTTYTRLYPTMLVQSDGSTINIRYKEPRRIIALPLDITKLTEEEQRAKLAKRRPKAKIIIEEEIDVGFDSSKYLGLAKKKP